MAGLDVQRREALAFVAAGLMGVAGPMSSAWSATGEKGKQRMNTDLTGGLPTEREYFYAEQPEQPEIRDALNVWIEEEAGSFGMRIGVEANSSHWDKPEIYLDVAFPDGRIMSLRSDEQAHSRIDAQGRASILGGGPLRFQVIRPFDEWVVTFDGQAAEISAKELIETPYPQEKVVKPVSFEITMRMAVPPWIAGEMLPEAERAAYQRDSAGFVSPRYEQLFRCEGRMTIGGNVSEFKGQGLRIRRQGFRKFSDFPGHVWQSCLFPSGKAFGLNTFGSYEAGSSYTEAYYFDGAGELQPARLVQVPWMQELRERGDAVPVRLETADGPVFIKGETYINCRSRYPASLPPDFAADYPIIQQSHARYRIGGEQATGMVERSTPPGLLKR